ncbi:MAG: mechanosensitive ion channel family protein, partial [Tannerella sp.]|nr:mechanosensitive ion channel family protein [Tannerella sp.]
MRKYRFILSVFLLLISLQTRAQSGETLPVPVDSASPATDSLRMAAMHRELEEARLNEINLRFELESVRMEAFIQDSVKRRE